MRMRGGEYIFLSFLPLPKFGAASLGSDLGFNLEGEEEEEEGKGIYSPFFSPKKESVKKGKQTWKQE